MKSRTRGVKYISLKRYEYDTFSGDYSNTVYDRIEIRTKDNRPMWDLFKEYINNLNVGQEFSRKEMLEAIYTEQAAKAVRRHETSTDHYRLYSTHLGYIDHVGHGKYMKRHNIPETATTKLVQKHAYQDFRWQEWFVPKHIRRESVAAACK